MRIRKRRLWCIAMSMTAETEKSKNSSKEIIRFHLQRRKYSLLDWVKIIKKCDSFWKNHFTIWTIIISFSKSAWVLFMANLILLVPLAAETSLPEESFILNKVMIRLVFSRVKDPKKIQIKYILKRMIP